MTITTFADKLGGEEIGVLLALFNALYAEPQRLGGAMLSHCVAQGYTDQNGGLMPVTKASLKQLLKREPFQSDPAIIALETEQYTPIVKGAMKRMREALASIAEWQPALYAHLWLLYRRGYRLVLDPSLRHQATNGNGSSAVPSILMPGTTWEFHPYLRSVMEEMDRLGLAPEEFAFELPYPPDDTLQGKAPEGARGHVFMRTFRTEAERIRFEDEVLPRELKDLGRRIEALKARHAR